MTIANSPSSDSSAGPAGPHPPSLRQLGWVIVFAAVVAQMPALRSWFAQEDWDFLARAAGMVPTPDWPIRPLATVWSWRILYGIFGLDATAYHGAALVGFALASLMALRVGARLGLDRIGLAAAGIWMVVTPFALRPIAWASASGEIWAALFALAGLDLWLRPSSPSRPWSLLAAVAMVLSFASKESALLLPLLLLTTSRGWPQKEEPAIRRARFLLGVALLTGAAITALVVGRQMASGPLDAYRTGGPLTVLRNLATFGAWFLTPFLRSPLSPSPGVLLLGSVFWGAWILDAWRRRDRRPPLALFAGAWAVAGLTPVVALEHHLENYYLLLPTVGVGWWIGSLVSRIPVLGRWTSPWRAPAYLLVVVCLTAGTAWQTHAQMSRRGANGGLADPILRRGAIALDTARLLKAVPQLRETPLVAILQATRVEVPEETPLPEGGEIIVSTPVYQSLSGATGLRLLLPQGVRGRWVTHLDDLPLDTLVLLDAGDSRLRVLGPLENARLYSAIIAVSAGQFPRARHDLWQVIGKVGTEVRFVYRAENLPIAASDLDAEAEGFVRYLESERQPASERVLKLFAQIYEAIRGQPLFVETWKLRPERIRIDDD